jgi:hypothetical protein
VSRLRSSYVGQHAAHLGRTLSVLLGGAGILTIVGIVQLVEGSHQSAWFWLFLGAAVVAIAEASAVHRDMRSGPQLRFVGTEATDAITISTAVPAATGVYWRRQPPGARVGGGPAPTINRFVRVLVANDPGHRVGECARSVVATIMFLDGSDTPLLPAMFGRWAGTPQRAETGRFGLSADESQLDIEANGMRHSLDVAMKAPGEAQLYAYNHENSEAHDLRLERHRLSVARCRVQISLRPANGRAITGTFVLHNDAEGVTLMPIDDAIR